MQGGQLLSHSNFIFPFVLAKEPSTSTYRAISHMQRKRKKMGNSVSFRRTPQPTHTQAGPPPPPPPFPSFPRLVSMPTTKFLLLRSRYELLALEAEQKGRNPF